MNKKDCKIVQDLLPNYIDKLTTQESNEFIENHLKDCKECKEILENMSRDLNVEDKKKDKKIINFIKKYNKKMRILKFIILLIVAIYLSFILRNAIIIISLINKANEQEITSSYSINYQIVTAAGFSDMNSIVMEDVYLRTHNFLFLDGRKTRIVEYCEGDTSEYYIDKSNGKKIAMLNHEKGGVLELRPEECLFGKSENIKTLIRNIFKSSIIKVKDEYVLDNDRYYISNYEWSTYGPCDIYVNINTGEICKVIKLNSNSWDSIFTGDATIDINFNNNRTPYYELPNIEEYEIVEQ